MNATKTLSDFSTMYTFNSLDLIERMEELQAMKEDGLLDEHEMAELDALEEVNKEGESASEGWNEGVTCVRDDAFNDDAYDLADACDMIDDGMPWGITCVDWGKAAREAHVDYTSIEVDGVTFWVR